eukprot:gene13874-15952_t
MSYPLLCIWQNRRRLDLESDFFAQGNFERYKAFLQRFRVRTLAGELDENDSLVSLPTSQIICAEFEEHKFRCHGHQCSLCDKSFPADRLLSLHISELHDSYFAVASKKKAMYCCLVEICNQVFWNDEERRVHLVKNHMFHPSYDFHNPKKYLKKFKSKLHPALNITTSRSKTPSVVPTNSTSGMETQQHTVTGLNRAQRRAAKFNTDVPSTDAVTGVSNDNVTVTMEITEVIPAPTLLSDTRDTINSSIDHCTDGMEIDDELEEITSALRTTNIQVPSKISFGRRRGHH